MFDNGLCVSPYQKVILFLVLKVICVSTLSHFDTVEIPGNAELMQMKLSSVFVMDQNGYETEDLHSASLDNNLMPVRMEVDLVCKGQPIHLNLHFHGNSGNNTKLSPTFNSTMEEIPVFTKSHDSNKISLDSFPRLYTRSCRTFRDTNSQAAFLVIRDPHFSSFKFYGSFLMGNTQYFVQPYAIIGNNDNVRLHVATETPKIDFSEDGGAHLLKPKSDGGNGIHKTTNQQSQLPSLRSDVTRSELPLSQKENIFRNIIEESSSSDIEQTDPDKEDMNGNNPLTSLDDKFKLSETKQVTPPTTGRKSKAFSSPNQKEIDQDNMKSKPFLTKLLRKNRGKNSHRHREKRQAISTYTVEIVIVCDFLCYKFLQKIFALSGETETKNVIALFFSYIREQYQISYSSVHDLYPELQTSIEITVPALYIATTSDDKIIGDYILVDGTTNVDSAPSIFEFAIWVQDNLKVPLKGDHYALVTGYDLYSSRFSRGTIGQVTRIPSVCDIDRVSINEIMFPSILSPLLTHELGHTLGAQHDSLTGGVCSDDDAFIMAASIGNLVPIESLGNVYRFSVCSASFFASTLPTKACLQRNDFNTSTLPDEVPLFGQEIPMESQCLLDLSNSFLCKDLITLSEASWDIICSSRLCRRENERCRVYPSLQFTTCGNKRWCEDGLCVDNPDAPETPVDCPAGDSPNVVCDVSQCNTYDDFFRFVQCCDSCKPIRTERFVVVQ